VFITGVGVVSPNGIGTENFSTAILAGRSGIAAPVDLDTTNLRTSAVAQVKNFEPATAMDPTEVRRVPRMVPLAIAAAREALESADLRIDPDDIASQRRIGVALGTGGGGISFLEEQYKSYFADGRASIFSITSGTHGNLSSEMSIALHLRGPSHVISTGCTSSTDAIGYAAAMIRAGTVPMMLAGGADAPIAPGILSAFERMKVISTRRWDDPAKSSRPFSRDRDGFVLGEGAWMFLLESEDQMRHRGARAFVEVAGYASTCDAFHRVQIAPDVVEPVRAIELALADADAAKDDVGYVNVHGTSTQLNDRLETLALKKCFNAHAARVPMSSTKSMIGHPQGACGAAGVAATILCMRAGHVHPTINLDTPDPDCDLDYVPQVARKHAFDVALCNCIAFGSKNSALVLRRPAD
jgi:3-oxoacyl-[acyl-carrier-protein] synthase II